MKSLEIRGAEIRDADSVWRLLRRTFNGPRAAFTPVGQPGYLYYLKERLAQANSGGKKMFVALQGGELVAFADLTLRPDGTRFLTRICVSGEYRGIAIASRMMKNLDRYLTGVGEWELDVFADNDSAISLYHRIGMVEISRREWLVRTIPPLTDQDGPEGSERISTTVIDQYRRYGFSPLMYLGHEVALAGEVVRCYSSREYFDDELLRSVRNQVPAVRQALLVRDQSPTHGAEPFFRVGHQVAVSLRMRGRLD